MSKKKEDQRKRDEHKDMDKLRTSEDDSLLEELEKKKESVIEEGSDNTESPDRGEMELNEKVSELEKERNEAKEKYLRTLAEFENFRRRNAQERLNWIRNANESLVLKICDVMDDFERAFQNRDTDEDSDGLYQGMDAIYRKLVNILKGEGVTKIEAAEMEFDPMYHDAITYTPSDLDKDKIVSVIENGYIMNSKVIRPAKVVLSAGETEETSESD